MFYTETLHRNNIQFVFTLLTILVMFQSCKVYQDPITLNEASKISEKGYMKVTMINGEEYIYESIEISNGEYLGIKTVNDEVVKTLLLKKEVKDVQKYNKKSSSVFGIFGILVGIGSVFLGVAMFGG